MLLEDSSYFRKANLKVEHSVFCLLALPYIVVHCWQSMDLKLSTRGSLKVPFDA